MASQVFDLRFGKGMSRGQSNEHLRNFSKQAFEEKRTHNFDPTREHLNFEVQGGHIVEVDKADAIDKRIKRNLAARGIRDPNEGLAENDGRRRNTVMNIIFQGSRERMRELAFGNQKIQENDGDSMPDNSHLIRMPDIEWWAIDMYNFACKKFGEKNIAAFVCHLDELNPHIHCTVIPTGMIKGKERISAKSITGQNKHEARRILSAWHDELAEINAKWGLERGRRVQETGARHRTTEEYWKELSEKCTALEEKNKGLESTVRLLEQEKAKAEKSVKGLTTMVANLNAQISNLNSDIERLREEASQSSADTERTQREMEAKKSQLEVLQDKLADKMEKLETAQQKVEELERRCKDAEERLTETNSILDGLVPEAREKSFSLAESVAWNYVREDLSKARKEMDNARRSLSFSEWVGFEKCEDTIINDDHIAGDIAESGAEIVNAAVMLYMGYIGEAMRYCQTSGGGGGGPKGGWGRKKDEDDRNFMGRCFLMARSMMKHPARGIKR